MSKADALDEDRLLAAKLRRSFTPFFGRFGTLRDVQRMGIPPILAGRDVLICAATASGKTETACAPLVERNMAKWRSWTVLYISPTRALVNDLFHRLEPPLNSLGLQVSRRTGDYHDDVTAPHFLLTTPESFDSLLCRGVDPDYGHTLAHVSAVVLDEVHLLHGSPRGEQVRWLLNRLRRLREYGVKEGWSKSSSLQVVALSATVPDPERVSRAYLRDGLIVTIPGGREIEDLREKMGFLDAESAGPAYIESLQSPEKVLVFSNSRKRVDALSAHLKRALSPYGYSVFGHHGSLAKPEREAAEVAARGKKAVVLVATATLEIGIDIGDIDLVVLDGPPPDIASLLQRIGRGNRRTGKTRVLTCGASPRDLLLHDALLKAARESWLGPLESKPHNAVARQQIASYVFQSPDRRRSRELVVEMAERCIETSIAETIITKMIDAKELTAEGGYIRLGDLWRDQGGMGEIHSTIEGVKGYSVVDHDTGAEIAQGIRYRGGKGLDIAGSSFEIKRVADRVLEAKRGGDSGTDPAQWTYHSKKRRTEAATTQAVRRLLGFPEGVWPLVSVGKQNVLFHFGGARLSVLLELMAEAAGAKSDYKVTDWGIRLPQDSDAKPDWFTDTSPQVVALHVRNKVEDLEAQLGRPAANSFLPFEVRVSELIDILDVDANLSLLKRVQVVVPPLETAERLKSILQQ